MFVLHLIVICYDLSYIFFVRFLFLRHANFPPKSAAAWRVTSVFVSHLFIVVANRSLTFFYPTMYCIKEQQTLRNCCASTCWGTVRLYEGLEAWSCGHLGSACLCKKHYGEQTRQNKKKCCFPLITSKWQCTGIIISCPQRLSKVFDSCQATFSKPGTFICEKHLKSADEVERICSKKGYIPPQKVTGQFILIPLFP